MGNEIITRFISEFSSPSVKFDETSHSITPMENKDYLNRLDNMRIDFIQIYSELPLAMQKVYLDELLTKHDEIIKRGFSALNVDDLLTFAQWGDGIDGKLMLSFRNLDDGLLKILNKTIDSVRDIVGEPLKRLDELPAQSTPQSTQNDESNYPDVISGTDGLKKYLGCSHNKAFDIIKSRVLPPDVQYMTGRVWKFNRKKLDEFIARHPEVLGKIRKGGVVR